MGRSPVRPYENVNTLNFSVLKGVLPSIETMLLEGLRGLPKDEARGGDVPDGADHEGG